MVSTDSAQHSPLRPHVQDRHRGAASLKPPGFRGSCATRSTRDGLPSSITGLWAWWSCKPTRRPSAREKVMRALGNSAGIERPEDHPAPVASKHRPAGCFLATKEEDALWQVTLRRPLVKVNITVRGRTGSSPRRTCWQVPAKPAELGEQQSGQVRPCEQGRGVGWSCAGGGAGGGTGQAHPTAERSATESCKKLETRSPHFRIPLRKNAQDRQTPTKPIGGPRRLRKKWGLSLGLIKSSKLKYHGHIRL